MKSKQILTGAMIVASGVAATDDPASAALEPSAKQPSVTESGVTFDMVKLDDDVLRLDGLAKETGLFGASGGSDGFRTEGEEYRIADQHDGTWAGGVGNNIIRPGGGGNSVARPGVDRPKRERESFSVTNPVDKSSMLITFDWITGLFFDPETNEQIEPPEWVLEEIEKLKE